MRRNYIGLAVTVHDPALAIVNAHGEVVFAEATERHHQVKRAWSCAPDDINRVEALVEEHGDPGADLVLARTWSRDMEGILRSFFVTRPAVTALNWAKQVLPGSRDDRRRGTWFVEEQARWFSSGLDASLSRAGDNLRWRARLASAFGRGPRVEDRAYDHHLCHAAAGCFGSAFDEALCAIIDGYGEKAATSFFRYRDGRLEPIGPKRRVGVPTSLGVFYLLLCWACGFDPYRGEEWKVMGLAAYGSFDRQLYEILRPMIRVRGLRLVPARDEAARIGKLLALRRLAEGRPLAAKDLAHTGQVVFDEIIEELLENLHRLGGSDNLVLGGGCALNSASNGRILERTSFGELFVPSAPGDDGNAVGAALLAYYDDHPDARPPGTLQSPYLGSDLSGQALARLETFGQLPVRRLPSADVPRVAARLLAEGKIVGWAQGRAEFGPRALGNRSILADPRRPDVKDALNDRVKFREEFRPFAPSVLHERGDRYFVNYRSSPYMERALVVRDDLRATIPGVVHVDGTSRLQSVERHLNPRYYDLIQEFYQLTDVPLVLNTSFNVMGKPIIHTVEDALSVFFTTGLDALVLDDLLIEKTS